VRRFLVVDDSPTVRLMLKAAIRKAVDGADVDEADAPDAALARFRETNPDVVFLDMVLGNDGTGAQTLDRILGERPEARIVLVTGLPQDHPDVVAAISRGAFAFVAKPVRNEAVRAVLDQVREESGAGHGRIR
jgi:SARP family transcriptional regulator, regulator of embCAB operon